MRDEKNLVVVAAVSGFLAVALGAFGAHGLQSFVEPLADGAKRLQWWQTGAHYHLTHALLAVVASVWMLNARQVQRAPLAVSVWAVVCGTVLFSGSLYAMALTGFTKLGAITPLGGLSFLVAWVCVGVAARR